MMIVGIDNEAHAILAKHREKTGIMMGKTVSDLVKTYIKPKTQMRGRPRNKKQKENGNE